VILNSDSFPIQIDSGASQSISNDKSYFESIKPLETNDPAGILGLTGEKSPIKGKGTIRWNIEDDNSMVHTIKLKNALYRPAFKTRLLCTRHWSQSMNNHFLTRKEHGKPLTPTTSSYIGTSADSKGQFHGMQAQIQDTYCLQQVPLTTESILPQSMQTTTLSDMNMFASTHTQMALTLFPMTSRMRIQQ
jgi:hypothetical protein